MAPLERAGAAAALCGVTRLADITGLDCIGLPVFQAVRPWGRALSVHQGKGLTRQAAQMGALMEAVESHNAESFETETLHRPFEALALAERAPALADFACDRDDPPDEAEPLAWVAARRLATGGAIWVPFDVVSLDFTRDGDRRLDRSSVGLGARFDREGAILTAILEVVERDADSAWKATPLWRRSLRRVDTDLAPYAWFRRLRDRILSRDLTLTVYDLPAVIAVPVFYCEIGEAPALGADRRIAAGSAAHPCPETALAKAVAEAAQSRLTAISGVRDDIFYPESTARQGFGIGLGLPLPPGLSLPTWGEVAARFAGGEGFTSARCAALLAEAGYPDAAVIDVSPAGSDAFVVKAVAPGLGGIERRRRSPRPVA